MGRADCSHIVHSPLQAPDNLFHTFDFMENDYDKHRQIYASMVAYLDTGVGKIGERTIDVVVLRSRLGSLSLSWEVLGLSAVDALTESEMWDNTIWFCREQPLSCCLLAPAAGQSWCCELVF